MKTNPSLHDFLAQAEKLHSQRVAIDEPGQGTLTYSGLTELSDRVRNRLYLLGVRPGDRVGIYLRKSIDAVAAIFGILKAGAAYVPVDPNAPVGRNAYILNNCAVQVAIVEKQFQARLCEEMKPLGPIPSLLLLDGTGAGRPLQAALDREDKLHAAPAVETARPSADDLAYILYTSGSTGKPKGVMLSHGNAVSFVNWCSEVFEPTHQDCFSSHAPLHFDLSILDLYVSLKHGAKLVLVGEEAGKEPLRLAPLISEKRISIWYSAPSILSLLAQYGNLQSHDYSALRMVLFAGEVFPVKHLRLLKSLLPRPRLFNLYGPTETNVCTFFEIPSEIAEDRSSPFPIGKTCSHLQSRVVNENGCEVPPGQEGELCITGAGVMQGYWNMPEQSARAFLVDTGQKRWYKTGDLVTEDSEGNFVFLGRRDRMVKRRGYRVELGEIEAGLYRHPNVKEAAVIAAFDEEAGVRIKAVLSCRDGKRPSLIELKRFCAENLPLYMVPDLFHFRESLPKTSTDKIDYQRLMETT
jgi:amino acid adenylation domain-containing protein